MPGANLNMKHHIPIVIGLTLLLISLTAHAQDAGIAGTWLLERATDFDGLVKQPTTDLPAALQILEDRFVLPGSCTVPLKRQRLSMGRTFQNLLKADVTETEIAEFYQKQFNLDLSLVKEDLRIELESAKCFRDITDLLQWGDTLVASDAGGQFAFLYKRAPVTAVSGSSSPYTQLPFDMRVYGELCTKGINWSNHKPLSGTNLCAPLYYPQIATASSTDTIARLVGHHNYEGPAVGLVESMTNDYTNPVESGFRPAYQVLPPKGDITLVHVIDEEGSSSRDAMSGAYLSIRNGKVVSQLNDNCTMGRDYVCRWDDGPNSAVYYTLNSAGEFVQHVHDK
jgi:hypothetical protein